MKKTLFYVFAITLMMANWACEKKEINIDSEELDNEYVNKWIHSEMSLYYYWNTKLPKSSNTSLNPDKYFDSILYKFSQSQPDGDRFSWIQDDYEKLQSSLSGIASDEIGFEYIFAWADKAKTHYYALVTYTMHGTDAFDKGVKRGQFITEVDGKKITASNYKSLFGGTDNKALSRSEWKYDEQKKKYDLTPISPISISMHKNFAENPVYMDSVYTISGKNIGYLVYNFFATDKGDKSNNYDRLLMDKLKSIKEKGATEMVLDLRYNSGGAVSSAIALSSALVKNRSTNNLLVTSEYNSIVHQELKKEYGADYNKEYFIEKIKGSKTEIDIPSLNLNRLYVLTGKYTASASEFVINGLKPYMDVILIGDTTYGKNVGSITIFDDKNKKNKWGMQPIIVKYFNCDSKSDFTNGFTPEHEIDEFEELFLVPFGETTEPLLGKAVSLITGIPAAKSRSASTTFRSSQIVNDKSLMLKSPIKFEMVDDLNDDTIKEVLKKTNPRH